MTSGPIARQLVVFAIPLLIGNIFQQLYNTVDSIIVGNFVSAEALGAVTSVGPFLFMTVSFAIGMSAGASVVVAQTFGSGNIPAMRRAIHTTFLASFWLSLILTPVAVLLTSPMLRLMQTPESIFPLARTYLIIMSSGMAGGIFYNMGSGILRALGDSKRPLYFLIFSTLLNIVLDLLFIVVFDLGVAGAAFASILAQGLSAVAIFALLFRTNEIYRMSWKEMHMDRALLKKILYIGLPTGIQMAITSFANVFVQAYVNGFGAASTSGWGAYTRIDAFAFLPIQSLGLAVSTFTGQNYGARNRVRIKSGIRIAMVISMVLIACIILAVYLSAPWLIMLFNRSEDVVDYGTLYTRVNIWFQFFNVINQILIYALQGLGRTLAPMVLMLSSFVAARQTYLALIAHFVPGNAVLIGLGMPVGWIICTVLMTIYYFACHWEREFDGEEKAAPAQHAS